jgi:uncharacterized membrane-anchored protein YhcB (DUF1043 family)
MVAANIIAAVASVVGAIVAFVSAIVVNRMARRREQELESKKSELQTALETRKTALQRELENFKADLDAKKSERDALLDYRYEARKRLYTDCEPVIFQLTECATEALYRIRSLARTARKASSMRLESIGSARTTTTCFQRHISSSPQWRFTNFYKPG